MINAAIVTAATIAQRLKKLGSAAVFCVIQSDLHAVAVDLARRGRGGMRLADWRVYAIQRALAVFAGNTTHACVLIGSRRWAAILSVYRP
jgi:hypothetical protein